MSHPMAKRTLGIDTGPGGHLPATLLSGERGPRGQEEAMDLTNRRLWQVGAGDTERSYGHLCIQHDVMIAGPGNLGPFVEDRYAHLGDIKNSLYRMCSEAQQGDVVLLRIGTGEVLAVGEVADGCPSAWNQAFGDIDGWDLQHVRRVRWFHGSGKKFPPRTLGTKARTFAEVHVRVVREWVEALEVPTGDRKRPLATLPDEGQELTTDELGRQLFSEGLASEYVDKLMGRFASLARVASWYRNGSKRPEGRPSEHETVAYLVLPLLLSLGWSEQTAAVEWNHVDVALFKTMPSEDATLACVVEAKLLDRSVFSGLEQAVRYANRPARRQCDRVVVTDGIRYALHLRDDDEFRLGAYLNILRLRDSYPVYPCAGAAKAILGMAKGPIT